MLESALDADETSRLQHDEGQGQTFIVMKRPHREENGHPEMLGIISVGALLQPGRLVIVTTDDDTRLVEEGDRAESPRRLLLRLMASTVNEFLLELKMVKRTSRDIQARLAKSFENRELLRMLSLSEGLVYHINAIDGNGRVLRKLRHLAGRLGLDETDLELLDDIVIDNDQCSHQAQIFSTVLAGLLDARGNIINNNMNIVIKNLTIVNAIFLPLGLIARMGGMSEFPLFPDALRHRLAHRLCRPQPRPGPVWPCGVAHGGEDDQHDSEPLSPGRGAAIDAGWCRPTGAMPSGAAVSPRE